MQTPSDGGRHILTAQPIDVHGPGTIRRDFDTLLDEVRRHRPRFLRYAMWGLGRHNGRSRRWRPESLSCAVE